MIQGREMVGAALGALLLSVSAWASPYPAVPGEYVVKLRSPVDKLNLVQIQSALGGQVREILSKESNSVLVVRPKGEVQTFALQSMASVPEVVYAEPNYIYSIGERPTSQEEPPNNEEPPLMVPNDPDLHRLWGLINTGQKTTGDMGDVTGVAGVDVEALKAWQITTGNRNVKVAVIDTGVAHQNPDLLPNMWVNEAELNGQPGIDDDNNGCIDDIYGCDFVNNDGDPFDDHGHGTHVSGTIAANGNDGIGIVGVSWQAQIVGVKFLSASGGGTLANAVKSIDYATGVGVHVMNNSWGGGGFSQALYDSIDRARQAGILFLAAAGNESSNNDSSPAYPASYQIDNVVSVAAIDASGSLAYFSNYGRRTVHVAAPGVNVYSTVPNGFASWSGTSMACPHVAGIAALVFAALPELTYQEVRDRIVLTARPLPSLSRKVKTGLASAYNALVNELPPPDPNDPTNWEKRAESFSTPHPYLDNHEEEWVVQVEGASRVALYFKRFDTERNYDKLTIMDKDRNVIQVLSGNYDDGYSEPVPGDTVIFHFKADHMISKYGFDIEAVAFQK